MEAVAGRDGYGADRCLSLDLALYPNMENATLTGALALFASGTAGDNVLGGELNSAAQRARRAWPATTPTWWAPATRWWRRRAAARIRWRPPDLIDLANYANVENVVLRGDFPLALIGLRARGTAGANTLDGAQNSAPNELTGLGGNDVHIVGNGDTVVEAPAAAPTGWNWR